VIVVGLRVAGWGWLARVRSAAGREPLILFDLLVCGLLLVVVQWEAGRNAWLVFCVCVFSFCLFSNRTLSFLTVT